MIERVHLNILREVERRGSLTAAAQSLHLTQSALSHTVKKLEQQLGTAVWHKEGRKLKLTQAGLYLLKEANRLLPQLARVDQVLAQFASGEKGTLRIGMECHPCYQWLLKVVQPFLQQWPEVDIDVKQRFQFGGMAALFGDEIDVLVTPDPLQKPAINFIPVFNYEQVLVVSDKHRLAERVYAAPEDLCEETLYTYPVDIARLDVFTEFLLPAHCSPRKHKLVEATEMMLQLVAAGRGVTTLPRWLVEEQSPTLALRAIKLGAAGIYKHIHLGMRANDKASPYIHGFLELAEGVG